MKSTLPPGVLEVWPAVSVPPNATRRSELPTEFHAESAALTSPRIEPRLSLGANTAGPESLTKNVTVLLGSAVRSNFS